MIKKLFLLMILAISTSAQAYNLEIISKGPNGRNYWKITCKSGAFGRCSGLEDYCKNRAANWCGETSGTNGGLYGTNGGLYGTNGGLYETNGGTHRSNTAPRSIFPPLLNSKANAIRK